RPPWGSPGAPPMPASRASPSVAASRPTASTPWPQWARSRSRSWSARCRSRRRWRAGPGRSSGAENDSLASCRSRPEATTARYDGRVSAATTPRRRPRKSKFSEPGRTWAKTLERYRPGLVPFMLDGLAGLYGRPTWQRRLGPTSELILTILPQNSADTNAEVAFEALRARYPGVGEAQAHNPGSGWGGEGLPDGVAPDWAAIEFAPLPELVETIWPGGLGNQKAPRIQATLRHIREERGDYSLEFLGDMPALEARAWLTQID